MLFPLLARQTVTLTILSVTNALREFTFLYVLTEGGPDHQTELPSLHILTKAFNLFQQGYASALATVLFAITLAITAANSGSTAGSATTSAQGATYHAQPCFATEPAPAVNAVVGVALGADRCRQCAVPVSRD